MTNFDFGIVVKTIGLLLLLWLLYLLRDLVLILLTSVVIASAVEPAVRWFGRYRIPRLLAVIFIYLVTLGLLFTVIPFLFFSLLGDLRGLLTSLQESFADWFPGPDSAAGPLSVLGEWAPGLSWEQIATGLQNWLTQLGGGFLSAASLIFGGIFSFILILVFSFYLSVQEQGVENFLRLVSPAVSESYILNLWQRARAKIGRWLQGQLVLGLLIGIMVYLGLTILGFPHALTLAVIAAVLELIPWFGPVLAAAPAILLALADGLVTTLLVIGLYLIIQQFENHLLQPLVINKIIGVPPLVVIIALLVGAKLAGFLGIILAAPAAAVVMEILEDFEKKKRGR